MSYLEPTPEEAAELKEAEDSRIASINKWLESYHEHVQASIEEENKIRDCIILTGSCDTKDLYFCLENKMMLDKEKADIEQTIVEMRRIKSQATVDEVVQRLLALEKKCAALALDNERLKEKLGV